MSAIDVKKLDSILFHASLGSVGEKVKRIIAVSTYIAIYVARAAYLAKADLATSIVKDFPQLQGTIGGYYASHFREDEEIVEAITEHYKPIGSEKEFPKTPAAIADKVDSLVGLIAAGEKISGSYDQFGLRRMAIGIIRTILENNLHVPIRPLIDKSVSLYSKLTFTKDTTSACNPLRQLIDESVSLYSKLTFTKDTTPASNPLRLLIDKSLSLYSRLAFTKDTTSASNPHKQARRCTATLVYMFCTERFKVILRNKGVRQGIVDSILWTDMNDLLTAEKRAVILDCYLSTPKGEQILSTYKRVSNMVNKVRKNDDTAYGTFYNTWLLIEKEEVALSSYAIFFYKSIKQAMKSGDLNAALEKLTCLTPFINKFMDSVKVNCDSDKLRRNRLSLLENVVSIFHLVARSSLIQVKQ
jgi:glycyl-tRNA synthetase beta chain